MKVGFIGAGTMAQTFGRHLLTAGHEIVVSNSRGPASLVEVIGKLGNGASVGNKQEAVDCDVTILATNWVSVPQALAGIDWRGRILIDGTNAHKALKESPDRLPH
jgi:predicted dinucleotide-binding enzyme